jgi:hypothetical protein
MIKKSVFEEELIAGMQRELVKTANQDVSSLDKAVDYLNSAIEIFENAGMATQANQVLKIISKIACDENDAKYKKPKNPTKVHDGHTNGLTSERMTNNLKNHGTVFNLSDDGQAADDFLNAEVGDLEVSEKDLGSDLHDFEDERE